MKKDEKFLKKAIKKMTRRINKNSGSFSFKSFKFKMKIFANDFRYSLLDLFSNKNFYDGFFLSFTAHIMIFLFLSVYPFVKIKPAENKLKSDPVIIFDLSDLDVGADTILPTVNEDIDKKLVFEEKKDNKKPVQVIPSVKKEAVKNKIEDNKTDNNDLDKKEDKKQDTKKEVKKDNKTADKDNKITDKKDAESKKDKKKDDKKSEKESVIENKVQKEDIADVKEAEKNITGDVDDLLVDVKKNIKGVALKKIEVPAVVKSNNVNNLSQGQRLQASYIDMVKFRVQNCWDIDVGAQGVSNMKIHIKVYFLPNGYIKSTHIMNASDYAGLQSFKAVADSARRAIVVCAPYKLPKEAYEQWKVIDFNFYPDKKNVM